MIQNVLVLFYVEEHPYYNLQYFTWAPFMSDGFKVSYVICAAMKNLHNVLYYI